MVLFLALTGTADPIAVHLAIVEAELRQVQVADPQLAARRSQLLDELRAYRLRGVWPHNHALVEGRPAPEPVPGGFPWSPGRSPVFIDEHGTPCAVGRLLIASGAGDVAAQVHEQANLAYISELDLEKWAADNGFTVEELARIQPGYESTLAIDTTRGDFLVGSAVIGGSAVAATTLTLRGQVLGEPRPVAATVAMGAGALAVGVGWTRIHRYGDLKTTEYDPFIGELSTVVERPGVSLVAHADLVLGAAAFLVGYRAFPWLTVGPGSLTVHTTF